MKRTIAIIADLGEFSVYQWENDAFHSPPRLELINRYEATDARGTRTNTLTAIGKGSAEQANIPRTIATGSEGKQHTMQLEKRRRLIREMACRIADLLKDDDVERCFLAVSEGINSQVVESIAPDLRRKIEKNVPRDLTQLDQSEMIEHFADRAVPSPS